MKKFIKLSLSATLFLGACAPQKEIVREVVNAPAPSDSKINAGQRNAELISLWRELNVGSKPNMALAEFIFSQLDEESKKSLRQEELPKNRGYLVALKKDKDRIKDSLIRMDLESSWGSKLIEKTVIFGSDATSFTSAGFVKEFDFAMQNERQKRAMAALNEVFERKQKDIAMLLAPNVLKSISPKSIEEINGLRDKVLTDKIKGIREILLSSDKVLSAYNFNTAEDGLKLSFIAVVAATIAQELEQKKNIQTLLAAASFAGDVSQAIGEFAEYVKIAKDAAAEIKGSWEKMGEALKAMSGDLNKLQFRGLTAQSKVAAERLLGDLTAGTLKEGKGGSFVNSPLQDPNLKAFTDNAKNAANGIGIFVNKARAAMTTLGKMGIKVDRGVSDAIETASQIASGIQLASQIGAAISTGGVSVALEVLAGGSLPGIGGSASAEMASIRQDLHEIKEMQKQMLQMQMETMEMIEQLSVLLESYHREEMALLQNIYAEIQLVDEMAIAEKHQNVRDCQAMIDYVSNHQFKGVSPTATKIWGAESLEFPRSAIYATLADKNSLRIFLESSSPRNFENCQRALHDAFTIANVQESPLSLKSNKDEATLRNNIDPIYAPLRDYLFRLGELKFSLPQYGLHLPAYDMQTMEAKISLAESPSARRSVPRHELKEPLSVGALERYSVALLNLGPVVSLDKREWDGLLETGVVPKSYQIGSSRYAYWLRNALFMVQSAIAQGALLAGEPLLVSLYDQVATITGGDVTNCDSLGQNSLNCALKKNSILAENFFNYILLKRVVAGGKQGEYMQALADKDLRRLQVLLGPEFVDRIVVSDGVVKMNWNERNKNYFTLLPDISKASGVLKYSDNMARLIRLQQKLADAILEVSPGLLGSQATEELLKVIAVKSR